MKASVRFSYFRFMNKYSLLIILFIASLSISAQKKTSAAQFQKTLNVEFGHKNFSPLGEEERLAFKELPFFKISRKYRIKAKFIPAKKKETIRLKTNTTRLPAYYKLGKVQFKFKGETYSLDVYQYTKSAKVEETKNDIFLPFKDATNGSQTYGGGRYLDLKLPQKGSKVFLDFNKAYNPYCAYSKKYSCPIVPDANSLPIEIKAGVQFKE